MTTEKKILEHLDGFPIRQKELNQRFDKIEQNFVNLEKQIKEGLKHPEPAARTIVMIQDLKEIIEAKTEADTMFKNETNAAIAQLNELMPLVREKLLPAYEKDARKQMAIAWFKERATNSRFWFGWLASISMIFMGAIYTIKQFLKD